MQPPQGTGWKRLPASTSSPGHSDSRVSQTFWERQEVGGCALAPRAGAEREQPPWAQPLPAGACFLPVQPRREQRHAHGSWTVSLGLMVGWGLLAPRQPHWGTQRTAKQTVRVNHSPRRVRPDTCVGCVGEKAFSADTGTCACWAVRATRSPELPKTLPKCFSNANAC